MSETASNSDDLGKANRRLKDKLLGFADREGAFLTAVDGLKITRFDRPQHFDCCFYAPSIGVVVQGEKRSAVGEVTFIYGENQCLVNGIDMPGVSSVTKASPQRPFLSVSISVDRELTSQLSTEMPSVTTAANDDYSGMLVADADADVLDAFARLINVLNTPDYVPVLAPLIIREIHYLILAGRQGESLRKIVTSGSHSNQIAQAVSWLKDNFAESIPVDELAKKVNMTSTSFYRYFKQVTSLTPLQFQKSLRLHEAQRLMLNEGKDANTASFSVGYESPAQFNRDYKRMFGEPPLRNVHKLRQAQR